MNFISKLCGLLFGSITPPKTTIQTEANPARNATLSDGWLTLTQPYFFGQAKYSPSKCWIVGCDDSDGAGTGGYREDGQGRVVLLDYQSDKIVHEWTCFARPVDAAVSDVGDCIVHDSGFGSALQGDLVAVSADGRERHRRHYCANIFNIGISRCGRYAAIQTANAPCEDGNLLEVLDLEHRCTVFSVHPITGWADQYSFDVNAEGYLKTVKVEFKKLGRFSYSSDGNFLDFQVFQAAKRDKGDYSTKIMAARDLLKADTSLDSAWSALRTADQALAEGAKDRPDWASIAHRVRGESYELLGQLPEALEAFDQALSLNPKVGVQKRATALRKRLGTS